MHFNEDRQVFILSDGREFTAWEARRGEQCALIFAALKEGSASEFNYQRAKQDQNEILKLRAELEAAEAILSLYRDAAAYLITREHRESIGQYYHNSVVRFKQIRQLTPASVGEEFTAMRSALMQANAALSYFPMQGSHGEDSTVGQAINRICDVLGQSRPLWKELNKKED